MSNKMQNTQKPQKSSKKDTNFIYSDLSHSIIDCFHVVYNEMGYGFSENVYENSLARELRDAGHTVHQQQSIRVYYKGDEVGHFIADIVVNRKIILELKTVKTIASAHKAQLLNFLKATDAQVGYVLNFGPKPQFDRKVYSNSRKRHHIHYLRPPASSAKSASTKNEE